MNNSVKYVLAKSATLFLSILFINAYAATEVSIESIDSTRFPTIYTHVSVKSGGVVLTNLTNSNFKVHEDLRPQTDTFQVTPPNLTAGDRRADIVFLIDVSGSMGSSIAGVRSNVNSFANSLAASGVNFALGLVKFGNGSGPNPTIFNNGNLTTNISEFQGMVNSLSASGGTEPSFLALRQATVQFDFRPGPRRFLS